MRKLVVAVAAVVAVAVGVLVGALAASGGSSASSASEQEMRRNADLWEIDQLEKSFHRATSRKDIELMMSLYAPNATFTFPGSTAVGKKEIRQFWLERRCRSARKQLDLRHARVQGPHHGQRRQGHAVLRVPLHRREDGRSMAVTAADGDVERIDGRWLITNIAGASATLRP